MLRAAQLLIAVVFLLTALPLKADDESWICKDGKPQIVVLSKTQKLYLCEGKSIYNSYSVSIGKEGWGKTKQGDNKTPLGNYRIGLPRTSERFIIFIPIGYPTQAQAQQGYTGGDIGVHGPLKRLRWLGRFNNIINWTQGCIAVGRESEIVEIAEWVKKAKPTEISIE